MHCLQLLDKNDLWNVSKEVNHMKRNMEIPSSFERFTQTWIFFSHIQIIYSSQFLLGVTLDMTHCHRLLRLFPPTAMNVIESLMFWNEVLCHFPNAFKFSPSSETLFPAYTLGNGRRFSRQRTSGGRCAECNSKRSLQHRSFLFCADILKKHEWLSTQQLSDS
jgi:hypothetical protein